MIRALDNRDKQLLLNLKREYEKALLHFDDTFESYHNSSVDELIVVDSTYSGDKTTYKFTSELQFNVDSSNILTLVSELIDPDKYLDNEEPFDADEYEGFIRKLIYEIEEYTNRDRVFANFNTIKRKVSKDLYINRKNILESKQLTLRSILENVHWFPKELPNEEFRLNLSDLSTMQKVKTGYRIIEVLNKQMLHDHPPAKSSTIMRDISSAVKLVMEKHFIKDEETLRFILDVINKEDFFSSLKDEDHNLVILTHTKDLDEELIRHLMRFLFIFYYYNSEITLGETNQLFVGNNTMIGIDEPHYSIKMGIKELLEPDDSIPVYYTDKDKLKRVNAFEELTTFARSARFSMPFRLENLMHKFNGIQVETEYFPTDTGIPKKLGVFGISINSTLLGMLSGFTSGDVYLGTRGLVSYNYILSKTKFTEDKYNNVTDLEHLKMLKEAISYIYENIIIGKNMKISEQEKSLIKAIFNIKQEGMDIKHGFLNHMNYADLVEIINER